MFLLLCFDMETSALKITHLQEKLFSLVRLMLFKKVSF